MTNTQDAGEEVGGTTSTLLDRQLPRLESSGVVPRVVTLTVGGNDVLGAYGDTRRALETVALVGAGVAEALVRLRAIVAADAPIVGSRVTGAGAG
jgi:lysophospholipase L1-like esterase